MIPTPAEAALVLSQSAAVSLLVKATLWLVIGLTAVALARRTRASVRHLMLAATFAALVATPLIVVSVPETTIVIPVRAVSAPAASLARQNPGSDAMRAQPATPPVQTQTSVSWQTAVLALWATGALLFFLPVVTTLWTLRSLRRRSLPSPALSRYLVTLARECGLQRQVEVLGHEDVASPITFGVWRPVILMPTSSSEWSEADLRRALVHELEHVRRGDWLIHLIARTASAAYWFHPLAWVAWRQLVLEAERSCDDAVVARDEGADYAEQLVLLAKNLTGAEPAIGMAHRSDLAARVSALLDEARPRGRAGIAMAAATIATATVMLAGLAPLRAIAVAREDTLSITVPEFYRRNPRVLIGDQDVAIGALMELLRRQAPTRVVVQGNARSPLQDLTEVIDIVKQAGVEHVAIAEQPRTPRRLRALDRELVEAAQNGGLDDVKDLIDAGANVDAAIDGDGSPLIVASRANRLPIVVELLNRGADVNFAVSGDGNPLIAAAASGAEAIVDLLLSRGAAIDLVVPGDENALIQAANAGHFAIVKMLVERGANVNARVWVDRTWPGGDGEWRTPLGEARKEGHGAIVAYLLRAGARE